MEYISHEDYKKMMSKFQEGTEKTILKEGLDPVGQEDSDIDNDGDTDKTDKYLLNRRKAVGKAINRAKGGRMMKEGDEEVDKKLEKIADLHKGKKVDFETIEKIAKALEGQGHEVNARYVQQFLSKHGIGMNEYSYTDNYPGSWGYREDKLSEDDYTDPANAQSGDTDAMNIGEEAILKAEVLDQIRQDIFRIKNPSGVISNIHFEPRVEERIDDYTSSGWLEGEDDEYSYYMPADFVGMGGGDYDIDAKVDELQVEKLKKGIKKEGLHVPPLQATGETISTVENSISNPPIGFSVLSPSEREQLKEYIKSIKEIKKEIGKLVGKAKDINNEEMGGNRTGLVMTSSTVSEDHSPEIEKIESKIPEKLYSITEKVLHELKKAGLTDGEIQMFINHEIEEIGKEAIMSQHDL